MAKPLRQLVSKKDHLRSKTPWEGAHKQGKMQVAKLDVPANHEKNFKAVDTKVYNRAKDNYGHPPEKADDDGSYGAAPDMTKEDTDLDEGKVGKLGEKGSLSRVLPDKKKEVEMRNAKRSQRYGGRNTEPSSVVSALQSKRNEETELEEGGMTRKHFRDVADTLSKVSDEGKRRELATHHAGVFAKHNSRFNHQKFMDAAGVKPEKKAQGELKLDHAEAEGEQIEEGKGKKSLHNYIQKKRHGTMEQDK